MKINVLHTRTITDPLAGIKFTAEERKSAMVRAQMLARLSDETQAQIRRAMAYEARRLYEAGEWTTDLDAERLADYERALVTLYALDLARTGFRC